MMTRPFAINELKLALILAQLYVSFSWSGWIQLLSEMKYVEIQTKLSNSTFCFKWWDRLVSPSLDISRLGF